MTEERSDRTKKSLFLGRVVFVAIKAALRKNYSFHANSYALNNSVHLREDILHILYISYFFLKEIGKFT